MQRKQNFDLLPGTQHLNLSRKGLGAAIRNCENARGSGLAPIYEEPLAPIEEGSCETPATTSGTPGASHGSSGVQRRNCGGWRMTITLLLLLGICLLGAGIGVFVALTKDDNDDNANSSSASEGTPATPTLSPSPVPPPPTSLPTPPPQPPLIECAAGEAVFDITITTDAFPRDTSWELLKDNKTIAQGGPYDYQFFTFMERVCVTPSALRKFECLTFTIFDTNGICCIHGEGRYSVSMNGVELFSGGQFTDSETVEKCFEIVGPPPTLPPSAAPSPPTFVPTQSPLLEPTLAPITTAGPTAQQTAAPTVGQSSEATPATSLRPSPSPTLPSQSNPPSPTECATGETAFDISITTDAFPLDTRWELSQNTTIIARGGPYLEPNFTIEERVCVAPNALSNGPCVTFTIIDDNGLCCKYGFGQYSVSVNGKELKSGGQFFKSESFEHCLT